MATRPTPTSPEEFFDGSPAGLDAFRRVLAMVAAPELQPVTVRTGRSQVALRRRTGFAFLWRPGQYLGRGAPVVLSVGLRERIDSPRWKQVVQPAPGRWMHHLEVPDPADLDEEVAAWVRLAAAQAG